MCRLFGMLALEDSSARDYLVTHPCSLLKQGNADPKRLQKDGWGVARFSDSGWGLHTSTGAVFREAEDFKRVVGSSRGRVVIAHLRKASNPLKIQNELLIAPENCQPYFSDGWCFAHNGQLNDPKGVMTGLGEYANKLRGRNDSEVLFWLFVKCIKEEKDPVKAIKKIERNLEKLSSGKPFTAINFIASDGKVLYAYCKFSKQTKKSVCLGVQGYYQMSYRKVRDKLVVMSERSNTKTGWKDFENGQLLVARKWGKGISVKSYRP
jgi:predicted glutamine amidotransferase